jgi:hypothetical protein
MDALESTGEKMDALKVQNLTETMSRRQEEDDAVDDAIHSAESTDAPQSRDDAAPRAAKKARSAKGKSTRSENAKERADAEGAKDDDDDDDDVSAWRIDRLRLVDFKSYGGEQMIGPFMDFQAIIGPNGAGARRKIRFFVGFFFFFSRWRNF